MSQSRRPYRKREERRVWVFSEPNPDLQPRYIARILTKAALRAAQQDPVGRPNASRPGQKEERVMHRLSEDADDYEAPAAAAAAVVVPPPPRRDDRMDKLERELEELRTEVASLREVVDELRGLL